MEAVNEIKRRGPAIIKRIVSIRLSIEYNIVKKSKVKDKNGIFPGNQ